MGTQAGGQGGRGPGAKPPSGGVADDVQTLAGRGLRVAIFTDETGWHTARLQKALRARGHEGRCVDLADCRIDTTRSAHGLVIPGFGRELPDAALIRGIAGGSFEAVTNRLGVLHALVALGVPVYNDPRAIERAVDKAATSLLLHQAAIPTPPTWVTESPAEAERIVMRESAAGHAVVVKPLFGSQGKGIELVGRVDGAHVPMPDLRHFGRLAYLQRFVPQPRTPGHDWRVMVVGGKAVTAMKRVSAHWIHNVARGAKCQRCELTPALAVLAERASAALGLDYAGVDIVPSAVAGGLQVIEVNGVAAWRGLQRVTDFDIAARIVDDLLDRRLAGRLDGLVVQAEVHAPEAVAARAGNVSMPAVAVSGAGPLVARQAGGATARPRG